MDSGEMDRAVRQAEGTHPPQERYQWWLGPIIALVIVGVIALFMF